MNALDTANASKTAAFIGRLSKVVTNETTDTCQTMVNAVLASSYETCNHAFLTNELLITLDFIKSEDKDFKPVSDTDAMLNLISKTIAEPFFPETSKKTVAAFVRKEAKKIKNSATVIERFEI